MAQPNQNSPILEVRDLTVAFGGVVALSDVDFQLMPGELHCLIGPNGAGKSTLFRAMTGQVMARTGDVLFEGQSILQRRVDQIARLGIGAKTQVPNLFASLSPREHLRIAARLAGDDERRVDQLIAEFALTAFADEPVNELSHGVRQRTEIATVLAGNPKVVLLDEPAAGLTDSEADGLVETLRQERASRAFVVVEHDIGFVRKLADRITVLHRGRIIAQGAPSDVLADAHVQEVYLGSEIDAAA